jgi:hypothetical protein
VSRFGHVCGKDVGEFYTWGSWDSKNDGKTISYLCGIKIAPILTEPPEEGGNMLQISAFLVKPKPGSSKSKP